MNKYFTESEVMTQDFLDWLESRHLKLRTTNEVRAAWFGWKAAHDRLLEAREKAVPFGYFGWREKKHMDAEGRCTVSQKAFPELEVTTPVYLHAAPADAERLAEALRNIKADLENCDWTCERCGKDYGMHKTDIYLECTQALAAQENHNE